jgi:ATP/maltotriose-dependent transcriptional regulator MalT
MEPESLPDEVKFTDRELEVLEQICKGFSNLQRLFQHGNC